MLIQLSIACYYMNITFIAVNISKKHGKFKIIAYIYRYNSKTMLEPEKLATLIKMHRKAANLTQLQLAELAGVGKTVVFDIEKGKETVKLQTLKKILKVLNIEIQLTSPLLNNQINKNEKS